MRPLVIAAGDRFGRLVVDTTGASARCLCDCGRTTVVQRKLLVRGHTRSCGCLKEEWNRRGRRTHGLSKTKEYRSWKAAKGRCYNAANAKYPLYGGRGIIVCDRWRDDFPMFLADMGPCPAGHTLDRIDVHGDYSPDNCRWATTREQAQNRQHQVLLTHDGRTLAVSEWARVIGVNPNSLMLRLTRGWTATRALTSPGLAGFKGL